MNNLIHKYDWFYPGNEPGYLVLLCTNIRASNQQISYKWSDVTCDHVLHIQTTSMLMLLLLVVAAEKRVDWREHKG